MTTEYDVIIVGAGSSGGALAARLTENSARRLLLLEAGPVFSSVAELPEEVRRAASFAAVVPGHPNNWSFVGNLTPELAYSIPRGKIMGGSSSINAAFFTRGVREDFDLWAELGNSEWSWDHVLPFYRKLEDDWDYHDEHHGAGGPIPVVREKPERYSPITEGFIGACDELGFPLEADKNAPGPPGVGPIPFNVLDGVRISTAIAYLIPNLGRQNLTVRGGAFVRRVLVEGGRAIGVEVECADQLELVLGHEVVLCAGSIKSPHILMLSGLGPARELKAAGVPVLEDLPYVGKNFTDHPDIDVHYQAADGLRAAPDILMAQAMLNYTAEGSPISGGMEIFAVVGNALDQSELRLVANLQAEESRGELRLTSADPHVAPELNYHYLSHPSDLRHARANVRLAVEMLESKSMRRLVKKRTSPDDDDLQSDAALDRWMLARMGTAFHTSSTCRMGSPHDANRVVDQRCRVQGVDGLRVVDTSIMPQIVRRGPNATAIMIGERASEFFD